MQIKNSLTDAFDADVKLRLEDVANKLQPKYRRIAVEDVTQEQDTKENEISEFGLADELGMFAAPTEEDVVQGFQINWGFVKWGKRNEIPEETWRFNKDKDVVSNALRVSAGLAKSVWNRVDDLTATIVRGGFAGGGNELAPDGLSVYNDSHRINPGSATTYDNLTANALSHPNLVAARNLMDKMVDMKGEPMDLNMLDQLVVTPTDLYDQAVRAVKSTGLPGTPNNDINPLQPNQSNQGRLDVMSWQRLNSNFTNGSDTNWFLLIPGMSIKVMWGGQIGPEASSYIDQDTKAFVFDTKGFAVVKCITPRGIIGNGS